MLLDTLEEKVESEDDGQEGVLLCVSSEIGNIGVQGVRWIPMSFLIEATDLNHILSSFCSFGVVITSI
jgi:hypothetical protein